MLVGLSWAAALALGVAACVWDLRTRRIPNALTFGAAAAALVVRLLVAGPWGLADGAAGWLTGAALLLPFYALGGLGGGDVKLLAAIGAWVGPLAAFEVGLYGALAGGVLAVGFALSVGSLGRTLRNVGLLLTEWRVGGLKPVPSITLAHGTSARFAYSIPIMTGEMCVWLLR